MRVLVAGACGHLGREAVRQLARRGHRVRAMSCAAERLPGLRGAAAETVFADLDDSASLRRAGEGVDAVLSCAGEAGRLPCSPSLTKR
ncbi:MAG TPA: NAD(P)H-binding protein [Longimicrobiaceae bacterium]|jgi:uncharacterized protein YbjT (DUF2867 family)|nr:NAD(P)H-binding protein [Longimicrobiaceae bacterium]